MSEIHYFQRYSQIENVVTNNTMLLFSRLYESSTLKFNFFLSELLEDSNLGTRVRFSQQGKKGSSIYDGCISQSSFKIIIETKLYNNFSDDQLKNHLSHFGAEDNQILLLLSPNNPSMDFMRNIKSALAEFNRSNGKNIRIIATTFSDIIQKFKSILNDYDYELSDIIQDYEDYCMSSSLIDNSDSKMRVVTCGHSLPQNLSFNLYFEPADRNSSQHRYLGLYSNKSVKAIGRIENIIVADLILDKLQVYNSESKVTPKQEQDIIGAMNSHLNSWGIRLRHRFFCVEKFHETDFRKNSKFPLQGTKFFDLKDILKVKPLPPVDEVAAILRTKDWENCYK